MANPFIGEIRMVGFNFAPQGWAFCSGQLMSIAQNAVLFNLIGTTYGGDGVQTFALPNLQGRIPVHQGPGFVIGQMAGTESVTLNTNQIPAHTHPAQAGNGTAGTARNSPAGAYSNKWPGSEFSTAAANASLNAAAVSSVGGSQPHDNMPPFLAVNFVISLFGIFPSQN